MNFVTEAEQRIFTTENLTMLAFIAVKARRRPRVRLDAKLNAVGEFDLTPAVQAAINEYADGSASANIRSFAREHRQIRNEVNKLRTELLQKGGVAP